MRDIHKTGWEWNRQIHSRTSSKTGQELDCPGFLQYMVHRGRWLEGERILSKAVV